MSTIIRPARRRVLLAAATAFPPRHAAVQPTPSRPVRLIVPSAPGGTTDIDAPMFAEQKLRID